MYVEKKELELPENILVSLQRIFWLFKSADKEIYLVGGCVRDMLLGKEPKDYDLCTDATPDEIVDILNKAVVKDAHSEYHFIYTGLKHGTITIHDLIGDLFYEITTYRIDGKYTDNRHPDEIKFTPSLEEDLKRRDFTINSFAYNPMSKELVILDKSFMDDLKYGIIRTVGNPKDRFYEDALRMLRAFRFGAQTGFTIETETYNAIKECNKLLLNISKERVRDELSKILLSDNPRYLELIVCCGLDEFIFEGKTPLTDMLNCKHENPWHYTDVFHHSLDVVERVPKKFTLRWAALLHDVGKPDVKKPRPQGPEGHYVYYGHPEVSAQKAKEFMQLLKFSNEQICKICTFIKYHDADLESCRPAKFKKVLVEIGVDNFLDFMELRKADSSAHELMLDQKYVIDSVNNCYKRYNEVINNPQTVLTIKDLTIGGDDLIDLGFKGKEIGKVLNKLFETALNNPKLNTKETLLNLAKEIRDGRSRS